MTSSSCPAVRSWQALLEESGPAGEFDELVGHLETCADCRHTLETLAADPTLWRDTAQDLCDTAWEEPALLQVMDRLKREEPLSEDDDLSFLQPTDRPELLGLLGPYEIQEEIGRGGMGVVLKALDPSLNRVVAIKVMSPVLASSTTARRRFVREAKAAAAVCHDHIVTVHGVSEADGLPYLVMQYIAGESLQARLEREGALPVEEIVRIGCQTASGLAAAHARGLIHRDIKPANLLLENGRIRITDFGLARMTDDVQLTQHGVVAGTPEYMAPEQARGESIDQRADLFSLGSVLYTLCTGVPAFRGSTTLGMLRQVSDFTPTPIRVLNPAVPVWLESLINRLMAKDQAERFQSAAEVAGLLEGYLAHLHQPATVAAPELPWPRPADGQELPPTAAPRRLLQRFGPRVWGTALVGLMVLGFVLFFGKEPMSPKQQPPAEIYQDFRNGTPLLPSLTLTGPDFDVAIQSEKEGMWIKIPTQRDNYLPVGLATTFSLAGDFEMTLAYDSLAANRPANGYGVGVCLLVATDPARAKFAKIARLVRPKEGSTYVAEFWNNDPTAKDYKAYTEPSDTQSGKLRLVREGAIIHCLVADGASTVFREIFQRKLTDEDLAYVHVEVVDSGSPGNTVAVRLLDWKIRSGRLIAEDGVSDPTKPPEQQALGQQPQTSSYGWWLAAQLLGTIFAILLVSAGGVWLYVRHSRRTGALPASVAVEESAVPVEVAALPIDFSCAACGKKLKARSELAGKKVKCTQCGQPVAVP